MDNLEKYEQLKSQGAIPLKIYIIALSDGLSPDHSVKLIRRLFNIGLKEAKDVVSTVSQILSNTHLDEVVDAIQHKIEQNQIWIADALQNAIDRGEFDDLEG